eukprot:g41842.t1
MAVGSVVQYCIDHGTLYVDIAQAADMTGLAQAKIQMAMDTMSKIDGCYFLPGQILQEGIPQAFAISVSVRASLIVTEASLQGGSSSSC